MTTTPEGRRELKAMAEAAAPGPWSTEHTCFDRKIPINGGITAFGRPYVIAHVNRPGSAHAGRDKANAAFIAAANPATVLSLLAALEEAEGTIKQLRQDCEWADAERLSNLEWAKSATALAEKSEQQSAERGEIIRRCQEELRLIRSKDTNAVYDTTLRVDMSLALATTKSGEA